MDFRSPFLSKFLNPPLTNLGGFVLIRSVFSVRKEIRTMVLSRETVMTVLNMALLDLTTADLCRSRFLPWPFPRT